MEPQLESQSKLEEFAALPGNMCCLPLHVDDVVSQHACVIWR